jgi:hypothetical protein
MGNPFSTVVDWTFLNEPAWRWALFGVGVMGFLFVWREVLDLMK